MLSEIVHYYPLAKSTVPWLNLSTLACFERQANSLSFGDLLHFRVDVRQKEE